MEIEEQLTTFKRDSNWEDAYLLSKKSCEDEALRMCTIKFWQTVLENSLEQGDIAIQAISTFVLADLENLTLHNADNEIDKALRFILTPGKPMPSLVQAAKAFVSRHKGEQRQYISQKAQELCKKGRTTLWHLFSSNWDVLHVKRNESVEKTVNKLKSNHDDFIDPFAPSKCECNFEQTIGYFHSNTDVVSRLNQKVIWQLTSGSPEGGRMFVLKSEYQGGRTTLGIWSSEQVTSDHNPFFPIYISVKDELDLQYIEREIARHLVNYYALHPSKFRGPTVHFGATLMRSQFNPEEILTFVLAKTRWANQELYNFPAFESGEHDGFISILKEFDTNSLPADEDLLIPAMWQSLPQSFQGFFLILDYSSFTEKERSALERLSAQLLRAKNMNILVLIPEQNEQENLRGCTAEVTIKYGTDDLREMLEKRLKKHRGMDTLQLFLTTLEGLAPQLEHNLPANQFIAAAQNKPGLLFQKGEDLLDAMGTGDDNILQEVYKLFYVPDEVLGLRAEKTTPEHNKMAEYHHLQDFLHTLNRLKTTPDFVKKGWEAQLNFRAKSIYQDQNKSPVVSIYVYELVKGEVRDQPETVKSPVRDDIISNLPVLMDAMVTKTRKGLLITLVGPKKPDQYPLKMIYLDWDFNYLVTVCSPKPEYEIDLRKLIENYYDWV